MSTTKKPDINKARLLALKKIGVLKETSARGKLTDSQKASIRKNWKKYHELVTAPTGSYVKKDVSHFEAKEKRALEKSGYKIVGNKVFIDKQGNDTATIKRTSVRIKKPGEKREHYKDMLVVERKRGDRKLEQEFIGTKTEKETWRENLLTQYQAGEFKKGDYIGIKIADGGIFQNRIYGSMDEIFAYAEYDFEPHDPGVDKNYLLKQMHLVRLSVKDYREIGAEEKTKKQRNQERYARSKKAKQLGVVKTKSKNKLVGKTKHKK